MAFIDGPWDFDEDDAYVWGPNATEPESLPTMAAAALNAETPASPSSADARRTVNHVLHAKWHVPADVTSTRDNVWALSNELEADLAAVLQQHLGVADAAGFELYLQLDLR